MLLLLFILLLIHSQPRGGGFRVMQINRAPGPRITMGDLAVIIHQQLQSGFHCRLVPLCPVRPSLLTFTSGRPVQIYKVTMNAFLSVTLISIQNKMRAIIYFFLIYVLRK